MHEGLPVSISPDDPGFMGYEGVTLDYLFAYLAWELDLRDLKQLCLNSITYSSLNEMEKKKVLLMFLKRWDNFINGLN